jgi:hypothetical protein
MISLFRVMKEVAAKGSSTSYYVLQYAPLSRKGSPAVRVSPSPIPDRNENVPFVNRNSDHRNEKERKARILHIKELMHELLSVTDVQADVTGFRVEDRATTLFPSAPYLPAIAQLLEHYIPDSMDADNGGTSGNRLKRIMQALRDTCKLLEMVKFTGWCEV